MEAGSRPAEREREPPALSLRVALTSALPNPRHCGLQGALLPPGGEAWCSPKADEPSFLLAGEPWVGALHPGVLDTQGGA